ncbi:MAG: hypothetical protein ACTTKW_09775, partial [Schwartzia sp. (in: firmicutes)]
METVSGKLKFVDFVLYQLWKVESSKKEELMNTNLDYIGITATQKPQVFLKSITFNDGTQLPLNHNSVIVFTGANNSGKSQVLRDVEMHLDKSNSCPTIVIKDIDYDFLGTINEATFLKERFNVKQNGYYEISEYGYTVPKSSLQSDWQNRTLHNGLHLLFIKRLSTEHRLTSSN